MHILFFLSFFTDYQRALGVMVTCALLFVEASSSAANKSADQDLLRWLQRVLGGSVADFVATAFTGRNSTMLPSQNQSVTMRGSSASDSGSTGWSWGHLIALAADGTRATR